MDVNAADASMSDKRQVGPRPRRAGAGVGVGVGEGRVVLERVVLLCRPFWPHPLILFTKLISPSRGVPRRPSADDLQERLVARQLGQVEFLPDARRRIAIARAGEGRTGTAVVGSRVEFILAAQAGQPVDQQHAIDVEGGVEADQARLVAAATRSPLTPRKPASSTTPCRWPRRLATPRNQRWLCGTGTHRRHREDLAGIAQRKQEAARRRTRPRAMTARAVRCGPPADARRAGSGGRAELACLPWPVVRGPAAPGGGGGAPQSNARILAISSVGVDRLDDVVARALAHAPDLVGLLVLAGAHDHRHVGEARVAGDRAGQLEAVLAGHHDVHQDQVGRFLAEPASSPLRRSRRCARHSRACRAARTGGAARSSNRRPPGSSGSAWSVAPPIATRRGCGTRAALRIMRAPVLLHGLQQLVLRERLGQVVLGADHAAARPVEQAVLARQHDHRHVANWGLLLMIAQVW